VPWVLGLPCEDFDALVGQLAAAARGDGIPAGFVPHSTYWLISNGEVVGVANLRHSLTASLRVEGGHIGYGIRPSARGKGYATELLRRTLKMARELGIEEAWLTCGRDNLASARVINKNGGKLESEEYLEKQGFVIQRYRIPLLGSQCAKVRG